MVVATSLPMIVFKYLKQQNWWYAIPCMALILLFNFFIDSLALSFLFATGFLICYSFKFANKYNNEWIDKLKLTYYFLYFTICILGSQTETIQFIAIYSFPIFIYFLYFYSTLLFYRQEMENSNQKTSNKPWIVIVVVQSVLLIGIVIWSITQKVEADKQKTLAIMAKDELVKSQRITEEAKIAAEQAKIEAIKEKENSERAKEESNY